MARRRIFKASAKAVVWLATKLARGTVPIISATVVLITADACGRYLLSHPIPGAVELAEMMLAAVVFLSLADTEVVGRHIRVEVVVSRLPHRAQVVTEVLATILGMSAFGLMTWQLMKHALIEKSMGSATETLMLPLFPVLLIMTLGAFCLSLVFLTRLIELLCKDKELPKTREA